MNSVACDPIATQVAGSAHYKRRLHTKEKVLMDTMKKKRIDFKSGASSWLGSKTKLVARQ